MLDFAMLFLRRKAWLFATNKRNQNFPMRFLICTAIIVLGGGAGAFDLTNVALNKPTDQGPGTLATVENGLDPSYYQSHQAVDGRTKTESEFCTHTIDARPVWWLVDLQTTYQIQSVTILNGGNEFENFTVDVFDQDPRTAVGFPGTLGKICAHHNYDVPSGWWVTLNCDSGYLTGRFLRVIRLEHNYLSFCEVKVMGCRVPAKTTYDRIPNKISDSDPQHFLGVFSEPSQCALQMSMLQQTYLNVFQFNRQDGTCKGYLKYPGLSFTDDDQWDTFVVT